VPEVLVPVPEVSDVFPAELPLPMFDEPGMLFSSGIYVVV
jgi:hypothetical protein